MTTTPLCLPLLSFSVQAANNKLISATNPLGLVPQLVSGSVADWAMKPEGCVPADRLSALAPGCGWVADRVLGLVNGGYAIGPYAGEDGRSCDLVWPGPIVMTEDTRAASIVGLVCLGEVGMTPAIFVGSPPKISGSGRFFEYASEAVHFYQAMNVASFAAHGILTIFDTGGCVGPSDARDVFEELNWHGVPFYLEPTRPYAPEASVTVRFATGLVSSTERMRTMEQETKAGTRLWFDTKYLEGCGMHDVEWCTGITIQYAMERARLRLTTGRRVIVPLRLCTEDHIRQLQAWADAGAKAPETATPSLQKLNGEIVMTKPGKFVVNPIGGKA